MNWRSISLVGGQNPIKTMLPALATEHEQMLAIMPTIRPQIGARDKRFIGNSFAFISGTPY
jgi:hypothetical protein